MVPPTNFELLNIRLMLRESAPEYCRKHCGIRVDTMAKSIAFQVINGEIPEEAAQEQLVSQLGSQCCRIETTVSVE